MQVWRVTESGADCVGRHGRGHVDTSLVGDVAAGDWLLTWLGAARARLSEHDAAQIELALDALAAAQSGDPARVDFDRFFPDLADREPELPAHLQSLLPKESC